MDENLIKKAFMLRFRDSSVYEFNKKLYHDLEVPKPNPFVSYYTEKNEIFVISEHEYFTIKEKDTVLSPFFTLSKFNKNGLQDVYLIEDQFDKGGIEGYIIIPRHFTIFENKLYMGVVDNKPKLNKPSYFLAAFQLKDGIFQFDSFVPANLPKVYADYDYNFFDLCFWNGYAGLLLEDKVYSLKDGKSIDLKGFPEIQQITGSGNTSFKKGMQDFTIDANFVYMTYWSNEVQKYFYVKYDYKNNKTIKNKAVYYNLDLLAIPRIEEFDYNYLITPLSENKVLRVKVE